MQDGNPSTIVLLSSVKLKHTFELVRAYYRGIFKYTLVQIWTIQLFNFQKVAI